MSTVTPGTNTAAPTPPPVVVHDDAPHESAHLEGLAHPVDKVSDGRRGVHHGGAPWSRIASMPIPLYLLMAGVVLTAAITGTLEPSMVSGFAVTMLLGGLFIWIGNRVPVIRDFGLPTILCTFTPATLVYFGLMPEGITAAAAAFIDDFGFMDLFVIGVIAGSILGMPRALLLKAGPRFVVPLLGCLTVTFLMIGGVGLLTGFGFMEAILMVAAPIMAGGLGLGALPMSEMYAARTGNPAESFMGALMSAVVLANVFCIIFAGLLNGLGRRRPQLFAGFNGEGQLIRTTGDAADLTIPEKSESSSYIAIAKGLMFAMVVFVAGSMIGEFLPFLHAYAWSIIIMVIVKIAGWLPQDVEDSATDFGDLVNAIWVPALLVGVSLTYIDLGEVAGSLSDPRFLLLTFLCVVVAGLSSGVIGWLVKFNFVEVAIVPGLVMADTGGSGDVSVLSASDRMHLMPFAAITNRIGGTLVLFLTSLLVPLLATAA
ncbi:2-hydroxycarboxylate transporter family protein [Micrococcus luteus]|uniref:2-hydroxycarboxylate transporter family protein n=1 Tax=Micrococcus luteus TaxID=1270 RepID=UPI0037B2AB0C